MTFAQAIRDALAVALARDPQVFVMGLGVPDPRGVFGTTLDLREKFGPERVLDMPVSENAMTGVAIGAALGGMRPVMVHQRADFSVMGMDQIINNAAKWRYMFGGEAGVPLTVRMIIGRGWGQGPQHSQNFQSLFAHVPGLKVAVPATPYEAKGLLLASIADEDPVIFIEHRWMYNQVGDVPAGRYILPLGKANVMRRGSDVTVVGCLDTAVEAVIVADKLKAHGISIEVVNLRTVKPLDMQTVLRSVRKTGRLLVLDSSWRAFGVSAEVAAVTAEKGFQYLKAPVRRLGLPDVSAPTSHGLCKLYYPSETDIARAVGDLLGMKLDTRGLGFAQYVDDVPDEQFKGPF
jgi:pyruvate dehydrogenase E1 component beta subunit